MSNRGSTFSMGYFSASIILHSLAVAGIFLIPQLELLDEGSGHTIEFVAMDAPKGEQFETAVIEKKEVVSEKVIVKNDIIPENLDSEISGEPVEEKLAKSLPEKEELLPEPMLNTEDSSEDKFDEFLAEEADPISEEAETATLAVIAKDAVEPAVKNTVEEDPTPVAVIQEEQPKEEASADSADVSDQAREDLKALAASSKTQNSNAIASTQSTNNASKTIHPVAQTQTNKAYGKPNGKIRNYLDLTQVSGNRPPKYPTTARRSNQQGQVQLAYYVKSDGSISKMKMVKSSGYPLLDQEAVRAVGQYRYKPGQEGWTVHPVNFQLQGPTKKMPSRLRTSRR